MGKIVITIIAIYSFKKTLLFIYFYKCRTAAQRSILDHFLFRFLKTFVFGRTLEDSKRFAIMHAKPLKNFLNIALL